MTPDTRPPEVGFNAVELLANLGGSYEAPFVWSDGGATTLVLAVAGLEGDVVHVVATRDPDFGDFVECPDALEVPVTVTFTTADGGFDEEVATTLRAFHLEEGQLFWRLPGAGSARVAPFFPADAQEPRLSFGGTVTGLTTSGAVGGDDAARPEVDPFPVARWGTDTQSGEQ